MKNVAKIRIHSYRGTNPSVVEYVNFDTGTLYPISELPDSDDDFSISVAYTVRCAFEYNPNTYQIINAKIPTISSSDYTYECMNLVSMAPAITSEQMSISSDSVYYDIKVTPRMKYRVNGEVTIPLIQYESFESFSVSI